MNLFFDRTIVRLINKNIVKQVILNRSHSKKEKEFSFHIYIRIRFICFALLKESKNKYQYILEDKRNYFLGKLILIFLIKSFQI